MNVCVCVYVCVCVCLYGHKGIWHTLDVLKRYIHFRDAFILWHWLKCIYLLDFLEAGRWLQPLCASPEGGREGDKVSEEMSLRTIVPPVERSQRPCTWDYAPRESTHLETTYSLTTNRPISHRLAKSVTFFRTSVKPGSADIWKK